MTAKHILRPNGRRRGRRGLSTLEMVLCLPILLFVMGLMINYGTVASWKVRALSVARHAAWSSRLSRSLNRSPRPDYWPPSADLSAGGAGSVPELDDPRVDLPVARGPLPPGGTANERLLNPARGLRQGSSHLDRLFPLLRRLGEYHLDSRHRLLDDKWQYQNMEWPEHGANLPGNNWRRMPVLYAFQESDARLVNAYYEAAMAILNAPFREDLWPLDADDEFLAYSIRFEWWRRPPDFHPPRREPRAEPPHDPMTDTFCSLDHSEAQRWVQSLIDQIQGRPGDEDQDIVPVPSVAKDMARRFIRLYKDVIGELQDLINAVPPPPPGEIASMQAEIVDLEAKIDLLTRFVQGLQ